MDAPLPDLSIAERLLLTMNIKGVVLCWMNGGFVFGVTDIFQLAKSLPHSMETIYRIMGPIPSNLNSNTKLRRCRPVSREEWPEFRDKINARIPGTYAPDCTFDEHVLAGLMCWVTNPNAFESVTFPMAFPTNKGYFDPRRRETFQVYYDRLKHERPGKDELWVCWAQLMLEALPLYKQSLEARLAASQKR
jgi:hypothetical protein